MNVLSEQKKRKIKKANNVKITSVIDDNDNINNNKTPIIREFRKVSIDEYFVSLNQQENHDMLKEDININLFYVNINEIKKIIKNMYLAVKEYKRLDFGGKLLYVDNQINNYGLKLECCDKFIDYLISLDNEVVTRVDKYKIKLAYNQTIINRKEIIKNKPKENIQPIIEKIKEHRLFLYNYIHEKMNILIEKYNIHINPFRFNKVELDNLIQKLN